MGITLWLHAAARRESRMVFATLARTNADFIRSARLPANERVAESIGRILNMQVYFRRRPSDAAGGDQELAPQKNAGNTIEGRQSELAPAPAGALAEHAGLIVALAPGRGIVRVGPKFEAIAAPIGPEVSLILVRPVEPALGFLLRPEPLVALVAFWGMSVGLAWALARGLVRPLRLLAERLPHIEDDAEATLPGAQRSDEIGQVARAYLHTRAQLGEERARRARAERLALLGRMATGLAHEIHNPLSAIRMHAQLIDSSPDGEVLAAARESLPVLLGETHKIQSLVNQWMFLARPEPPESTPADLGEIVADALRTLAPQARHAGVCVVNEMPGGLRAKVDARRISQAIGNIVINSIQAMPRGGTVTIGGNKADGARIIIRDRGPGFSRKALAHYADLFYSEKEGGMGIGLSVSSEILKAHGGAIEVANAQEGGGIVTMHFPEL
jgi:signal transduction histidine kinase